MDILQYIITLIIVFGGILLLVFIFYRFPKLFLILTLIFLGLLIYVHLYSIVITDPEFEYIMKDNIKVDGKTKVTLLPGSEAYKVTRYYDHYICDFIIIDGEGKVWDVDFSITGENIGGMKDPVTDITTILKYYVQDNAIKLGSSKNLYNWVKNIPSEDLTRYVNKQYYGMKNLNIIGFGITNI